MADENLVATELQENEAINETEVVARFQYEIEARVDDFLDEESILHNVYPDSDSDRETNKGKKHCKGSKYDERDHYQSRRGVEILLEGQVFYNGVEFKDCVLAYALESGRNIRQYRYDKTKLGYECAMGDECKWRVYCSVVGKSDKWQIKVFKQNHTCIPNGDCEMLKVPVIARLFLDQVRDEPEYMMPMKIQEIIKSGNCCEDVEHNSTESFNNTLGKAREKPFVPMLETIRRLAMVRISRRSSIACKHMGICTPYATKFIESEHEKAAECKVYRSTHGMFEVVLSACSYHVSLERRTCTCRKWELSGIPCEHAYTIIMDKKGEVSEYIADWFHTITWRNNYAQSITPLRGARFWLREDTTVIVEPPAPLQPGRKKKTSKKEKKRKQGKNESPIKKAPKQLKRSMHCKICGQEGHNSRRHKNENSQL